VDINKLKYIAKREENLFKWMLLTLLLLSQNNLFALEISMDSAKDNFNKYSTLQLSDENEFICQEMKNDFDITTEIVCAFSKRPAKNISNLQNDFFKVNTLIKDDTFFLSIKPIHSIKLISELFNLVTDDTTFGAEATLSNRWMVLGYKDKLPLINKDEKSDIGINFPFYLDKDKLPYVGSLDIKGNPVHIKKVGDVKEYLKIKQYYKEKKYDICIESINDILNEYPHTLFKAELIYNKIRVYSKLEDNDNVVSNAKIYLREYSSNENIPEVLALVARAYSRIGLPTDADYFFDRLFSEHENSVFTKWGYIYKGEMLEASGGASQAFKFYIKALNETKNLEVAATAAYRIANMKQGINSKESALYIMKIVNANPAYFMEDLPTSTKMMHAFEDEGDYLTAAAIGQSIINEINPTYDEYEAYLKDIALWLAKTQDKQKALIALNKYLEQFPDGDYINEVQIAKDALFFDTTDANVSTRLSEYNKLIEEYTNDTIGNRAIYEKAKLLLGSASYNEILDMKEDILQLDAEVYADKEDIVTNAAIGLMENSLKKKECAEVLAVSNEYNITLSNDWDDGIYECAMKGGDYQLSKSIVSKNLKIQDLELRKKWLYRYIEVNFATGNYSEVAAASNDLITLIEDTKKSQYKDVFRYLFDTYDRLEEKEHLVSIMATIEDIYGLTYKDIERYVSMISIGSDNKDDNMVIKYAKKVMQIQESSSSHAQSPYVEFTLYQSYMNIENYNKALDVIESLNSLDLNKEDRARQKYLLATVQRKLWRDADASKSYEESIAADPDSPWAKLAQSAQSL
jgi:tetratricopeptide (TPR) repeat protein